MNEQKKEVNLDTLVQEKIESDTEFIASLNDMSDEDKESAIATKRTELTNVVFKELYQDKEKNLELAKNYKIRAEKAERGEKSEKEETLETAGEITPTKQEGTLSDTDILAIVNAKVPQEDVEELKRAAKVLGKSIPEALGEGMVQKLLKERSEARRTAEALNTGKGTSGAKQPTGKELVDNLSKGEVPDKGTAEAEELFWAKRGGRPKD